MELECVKEETGQLGGPEIGIKSLLSVTATDPNSRVMSTNRMARMRLICRPICRSTDARSQTSELENWLVIIEPVGLHNVT